MAGYRGLMWLLAAASLLAVGGCCYSLVNRDPPTSPAVEEPAKVVDITF